MLSVTVKIIVWLGKISIDDRREAEIVWKNSSKSRFNAFIHKFTYWVDNIFKILRQETIISFHVCLQI